MPKKTKEPKETRHRFNKLNKEGVGLKSKLGDKIWTLTLTDDDYPIENSEWLPKILAETDADSVVIPNDYQLRDLLYTDKKQRAEFWLEDPVINPVYPEMGNFWDEMKAVVDAQKARQANSDAKALPLGLNGTPIHWPDIWFKRDKNLDAKISKRPWTRENLETLEDVAKAVDGEYPALHQQDVIETMIAKGLKMDRSLANFRSRNDFIGTVVRLGAINTWAFEAVAPVNFMLKWTIGMPRPEEIARKIANGEITPPDDYSSMVGDIRGIYENCGITETSNIKLNQARYFTAYPGGSPNHPSYPAMHSAGSTVSFWLPAIAEITQDFKNNYAELLRVDYAVAMGRTVAGVHYPMDNLAGLNIGQRIILMKLPKFLEAAYGYDAELVEAKLKRLTFDWNTYDSQAGTIDGKKAEKFLEEAMALSGSDATKVDH